ncbi:MAG: hypothetical protein OEY23_00250 [Acidimicrobiia bacterium]|nr:hypothetical protein [Acidimicrobiia bacterium]
MALTAGPTRRDQRIYRRRRRVAAGVAGATLTVLALGGFLLGRSTAPTPVGGAAPGEAAAEVARLRAERDQARSDLAGLEVRYRDLEAASASPSATSAPPSAAPPATAPAVDPDGLRPDLFELFVQRYFPSANPVDLRRPLEAVNGCAGSVPEVATRILGGTDWVGPLTYRDAVEAVAAAYQATSCPR